MHKRWGRILIIVVAMLAVCGGLASAHLPVQVLVDGKELEAKRPLQIVEGTVLVPVRTLAEALGATVDWDAKTRTVHVDNRAKRSLERRVARLEEALAPETPPGSGSHLGSGGEGAQRCAAVCGDDPRVESENGTLLESVVGHGGFQSLGGRLYHH